MTIYAETYMIDGSICGVEDYRQRGKHFMPTMPHKRYKSWFGGGGLGDSDTLQEARQKIYDYAKLRLHDEIDKLLITENTLRTLIEQGLEPFQQKP